MRWTLTLWACIAVTGCAVDGVSLATSSQQLVGPDPVNGTVGWTTYRRLDLLPYLTTGARTQMFSSYDRVGAADSSGQPVISPLYTNDDFINPDGTTGVLRCIEANGGVCTRVVIAERLGPGEIERIYFGGVLEQAFQDYGNLRVVLDDVAVLDLPVRGLVDGAFGPPFNYPLVANANESSGGGYIAIPMPFRNSMRVELGPLNTNAAESYRKYFQVEYRMFADASTIATFNPLDSANDVADIFRYAGLRDPKPPPAPGTTSTQRQSFVLQPGSEVVLAQASSTSGVISAFELKLPQVEHAPLEPDYKSRDGRAFGAGGYSQFTVTLNPNNTGVRVTRVFDAHIGNQRALLWRRSGGFTWQLVGEWWPIPEDKTGYRQTPRWATQTLTIQTSGQSTIRFQNTFVSSDYDFNEFEYIIDQQVNGVWVPADRVDIGHHADEVSHNYTIVGETWNGRRNFEEPKRNPKLFAPVGQIEDDGRAFGAGGSSTFTLNIDPRNKGVRLTRRFHPLIGFQVARIEVNGINVGQWPGIPSPGDGLWAEQSIDIPASITANQSSISVRNVYISSTFDFNEFTYWVDSELPSGLTRTDMVDVGLVGSETAHNYQIINQTWSGIRRYTYSAGAPLGPYPPNAIHPYPGPVTDNGRAFRFGGFSQFTAAIDPSNIGGRIVRRLDRGVPRQSADVYVDNVYAGTWQPLDSFGPVPYFGDEVLVLPANLLVGKSAITIKNVFVSSTDDFNEFTYWIDSLVANGATSEYLRTDRVDVGSVNSEATHAYQISGSTWAGTRQLAYERGDWLLPSAQAQLDHHILSSLRIRMTFDGVQTVDSPAGEFFGSPHGEFDVHALMFAIDSRPDGAYRSWWPMPFGQSFSIKIYNGSFVPITFGESGVTVTQDSQWAIDLAAKRAGYFRTSSSTPPATPWDTNTQSGKDWRFAQLTGHGKLVGVSQGTAGIIAQLEGDEKWYLNDQRTPAVYGTGHEEFHNAGWYFANGSFSQPLSGTPSVMGWLNYEVGFFNPPLGVNEPDPLPPRGYCSPTNRNSCIGAYRLLLADARPFGSGGTWQIEHDASDGGGVSLDPDSRTSTVFWYGVSSARENVTDTIVIGTNSENTHNYSPRTPSATSLFGWYEDLTSATNFCRYNTIAVSFRLTVDANNVGVILRRTSDQRSAYQTANVYIDGQFVGTWQQPMNNPQYIWRDDEFLLPPGSTAGKNRINVQLIPISVPFSPSMWSAAKYSAVSVL